MGDQRRRSNDHANRPGNPRGGAAVRGRRWHAHRSGGRRRGAMGGERHAGSEHAVRRAGSQCARPDRPGHVRHPRRGRGSARRAHGRHHIAAEAGRCRGLALGRARERCGGSRRHDHRGNRRHGRRRRGVRDRERRAQHLDSRDRREPEADQSEHERDHGEHLPPDDRARLHRRGRRRRLGDVVGRRRRLADHGGTPARESNDPARDRRRGRRLPRRVCVGCERRARNRVADRSRDERGRRHGGCREHAVRPGRGRRRGLGHGPGRWRGRRRPVDRRGHRGAAEQLLRLAGLRWRRGAGHARRVGSPVAGWVSLHDGADGAGDRVRLPAARLPGRRAPGRVPVLRRLAREHRAVRLRQVRRQREGLRGEPAGRRSHRNAQLGVRGGRDPRAQRGRGRAAGDDLAVELAPRPHPAVARRAAERDGDPLPDRQAQLRPCVLDG